MITDSYGVSEYVVNMRSNQKLSTSVIIKTLWRKKKKHSNFVPPRASKKHKHMRREILINFLSEHSISSFPFTC